MTKPEDPQMPFAIPQNDIIKDGIIFALIGVAVKFAVDKIDDLSNEL